ncbi:MAG: LamG domain-containing protein [Microcystis novacekii Mn_MB_F_20050700_S1]|uniref:LamG domain-containing protein n=1 Tax=Microcystis novacekii Mn_MB_F_20050700_S1D TaxID=2486266 RepID=A0A552IVP6_9CHRO|nr:MAG: LamG domain-containing protein [Microcystis novacekii Mn_MB_F_20050700_S1]TRU87511.1 MAG: LamG domain-containing protein [Microcystis novacekii Mn_MB_F_20050700_S1D]
MKSSVVTMTAVFTFLGLTVSRPVGAAVVSKWEFNDPQGLTAFDSVDSNNGTYTGYGSNPGPFGGILPLNGTTNFVDVPNSSSLNFGTGNFSVGARIKTTSLGLELIVDKRIENSGPVQGYSFFIGSGNLGFQLADGTGSNFCTTSSSSGCTNYGGGSATFIADGLWHDVSVTVDRTNPLGGQFFVDGILKSTFNPTFRTNSVTNNNNLTIGRRSDSSNPGFFNGQLSCVYVAEAIVSNGCQDNQAQSVPEKSPTSALLLFLLGGAGSIFLKKRK